MQIDLNCDLGEGFGIYAAGLDQEVMPHISSANVACGWHAGDPLVMQSTVELAARYNVQVGAHPGYPDLLGFGRRKLDCTPKEIFSYVLYQIGALQAFCHSQGLRLQHVKPHGALYHAVLENQELGEALAKAVQEADPELILLALAGPKGKDMAATCNKLGLRLAREAFPDRAYNADGTLVSRSEPGAVLDDPEQVAEQALAMARDNLALTPAGEKVSLQAQTLCVHGDSPAAVESVRLIRSTLQKNNIQITSIRRLV
ncbi:MAG: LamB/YcsF family protein [Thermodesulfobacteriota bacterium]